MHRERAHIKPFNENTKASKNLFFEKNAVRTNIEIEPTQKEAFCKEDISQKIVIEPTINQKAENSNDIEEKTNTVTLHEHFKPDIENSEIAILKEKSSIENQIKTEIIPNLEGKKIEKTVFYGKRRTKAPILSLLEIFEEELNVAGTLVNSVRSRLKKISKTLTNFIKTK